MREIFTRNLGWKITSVILAFLLWFAVIRFDDPDIDISFEGIPVTVKNEELITPQKYIVYKEGQFVDVKLRGKRSVMDKLSKEDITASVNMKYMSYLYSLEIDIETEDKSIQVLKKYPANMVVELENIKTEIRKVKDNILGDPKESYKALKPIITPNTIEITGPESKVAMVSQAIVNVSVDGATNDVSSIGAIILLDENDNPIDKIEKSVDEVNVTVPIMKLKDVNLIVNTTGKLPNGYKLTGTKVNPSRITLIGKEDQIDEINNLILDVSLDDITADTTTDIKLNTILPKGVSRDDGINIVSVKLEVDKIEEKEIEITPHDITIAKLPEGLKISVVNKDSIKVLFRGIADDLNKVHVFSLNPNINLNNLEEGRHEVDLNLTYSKDVELITELPKVVIELTKEDVETNIEE